MRVSILTIPFAALSVLSAARALAAPTAVVTPQSNQTLANAASAIQGHPAANKVFLIPDEPTNGVASSTVYVLPKLASASQKMSPIGTPDCTTLEGYANDVNVLNAAMATVALTGVDLALAAMRALDTYASFLGAHSSDYQTAAEGTTQLNNIDYAIAPLQDEKSTADAAVAQRNGSSVRQDIVNQINADEAQGLTAAAQALETSQLAPYDATTATFQATSDQCAAQIAQLQAQRQTVANDPTYVAAWAVEAQGAALLDVAVQAEDALHAYADTNMQEALDAVNAAKTNYNDLARTDAAYGQSAFPVWDPDMLNLVAANGGVRKGIHFVPSAVENISWTIDQGAIDVTPPFQYNIYARVGTSLVSLGSLAPWTIGPMPGSTVITTTKPSDVTTQQTVVAQDDTYTYVRTANILGVPSPQVSARLGLGAYCGAMTTTAVQQSTPPASDGLSASVAYTQYTYERSDPTTLFVRTAHGAYETPVVAPSMLARCTVDSADYVARLGSKPHDSTSPFWAWQSATDWGMAMLERLKNDAVRCEFPSASILTDDALVLTAREIEELAVSEATTRFTLLSNGGPPAYTAATPVELNAFAHADPDPEMASPTMQSLCGGEPTCHLNAVDPAAFSQICTTQGNETDCSQLEAAVWYSIQRTGAYYKPLTLESDVSFTVTK
jgi:hypothetical protein